MRNLWSIIKDNFPLIFICLYISFSIVRINLPGVNYDEIFYGNAALGVIDPSTFVESHFHGIPILIIPYIGALKSYIYFPIFKLFGVSPLTIRLPMILLAAFSLYLLFHVVRRMFNPKIAKLTLLLISMDPSFIIHSRLDFGPVVLSFFFRVLSLYVIFKYFDLKHTKYLIYLGIILALGLFNKMDFIWFISSFIVVCLLVYQSSLIHIKNISNRLKLGIAFLGVAIFGGVMVIFLRYRFFAQVQIPSWSHINLIIQNYFNVINGTSFYEYMIGPLPSLPGRVYSAIVLLIIILNPVRVLYYRRSKDKAYIFILIILIGILLQEIATKAAGASWHLYMTYPFTTILLAHGLATLHSHNKKRLVRMLAGALILGLVVYQIILTCRYIQNYDKNLSNINWSPAIYDLIDYTKKTDAIFVSIDWGTHNQLVVFNQERGKYIDRWLQLKDIDLAEQSIMDIINNNSKPIQFILHPSSSSVFEEGQTRFKSILLKNNIRLVNSKNIYFLKIPIYKVYTVVK